MVCHGKGGIEAEVLAKSYHEQTGTMAATVRLRYPRIIHSELMTHRAFSRNASSSRAKKVKDEVDYIDENPAMPVEWGTEKRGMVPDESLKDEDENEAKAFWIDASYKASNSAEILEQKFGLHKQICNRLLEPFQFIDTIVTSTEWRNFFDLRMSYDADATIRELAKTIHEALLNTPGKILEVGDWHIPELGDNWDRMANAGACARISYRNLGNKTQRDNILLAERLLENGHMSPFEHQLTPIPTYHSFFWKWSDMVTHKDQKNNLWCRNSRWFCQFRHLVEG